MKFKSKKTWITTLASILTVILFVDHYWVKLPLIGHLTDGRLLIPRYLFIVLTVSTFFLLGYIIKTRFQSDKRLILISDPAILFDWNLDGVTCEVTVRFNFNPNIFHNATAFANAIEFSDDFYCTSCESGSIRTFSGTTSYMTCSINRDHFSMDENNEFFRLKQKHLGIVKGIVRKDYEKYWKVYKQELNRVAPGKLEKYDFSWNKH